MKYYIKTLIAGALAFCCTLCICDFINANFTPTTVEAETTHQIVIHNADNPDWDKVRPIEDVETTPSLLVVSDEEGEAVNYIKEQEKTYTDEELSLLAHLINAEAGADWCDYEMKWYTGCVVLNRVKSDKFPNTIEEVIYQDGQYACIDNGHIEKEPTEEIWKIAEDLLENGSTIPESIVYQAEFEQGSGVWKKVQNMYFCHE